MTANDEPPVDDADEVDDDDVVAPTTESTRAEPAPRDVRTAMLRKLL